VHHAALRPAARRDAAAVAAGLRAIYTAPGQQAALDALAGFAASPPGPEVPRRPSGSGKTPGTPSRHSWPSARR
jgi:hypothetical protein